ncbi:MAG: ATP-binding protein [Sandaracinaceae bacterium]
MRGQLGRIRVRLFIVNVVVLLVPVAGLEFAEIYERQLLASLERDMRNQSALAREMVEEGLDAGMPLGDPRFASVVRSAARSTRTRIRILDAGGIVVGDSHAEGPPEGPEPPAPSLLPSSGSLDVQSSRSYSDWVAPQERWPDVPDRVEVRSALAGHPDAYTRIRGRSPGVFLFLTDPIRHDGNVVGVIYVTRSTQPVLVELYKIRSGLFEVLAVAILVTLLLTLLLSWSISRPLSALVKAARRIAAGARGVPIPKGGGTEIGELGDAFETMTQKLDARMRYISEFTADVAHELKSPLTSIRGAAELLREGADDDPEARERFLGNIQLDAERLDRLVVRLLELSRIDSSREPMEDFDLRAMVERVLTRTHTAEQPVVVRWATPVETWHGREEDLERAVLNLVENALRFSPDGVAVEVTIAERGPELRVAVRDRGPGVPEGNRHKIFERFFTTDAERNGTGLGLAIVRSVAQAHGGDVTLRCPEDGGSEFVLAIR